jgi:hypothetical protein
MFRNLQSIRQVKNASKRKSSADLVDDDVVLVHRNSTRILLKRDKLMIFYLFLIFKIFFWSFLIKKFFLNFFIEKTDYETPNKNNAGVTK